MSYYDDASLMFLAGAGAQKDGTAYSVKPVPVYGTERVTNGDFSDGTNNWTNNNSILSVLNGKVKVLSSSAYGNAQQNILVESGKTYKVLVDFTYGGTTEGRLNLYDGSATPTEISKSEDGIISTEITISSGQTNLRVRLVNQSAATNVYNFWDNVSIKEVITADGDFTFSRGSNLAATRVGADGLIEKGRENLLLQSNTFSDAPWARNNTSVTSGQSGYDGSLDAWKLQSSGGINRVVQLISNNAIYTFSVYAKSGTTDWMRINILQSGTNANNYYDIANGLKGASPSSTIIDDKIESVGNGWYRISIVSDGSITQIRIQTAVSDGNETSVSGDNIYIQDAQLEQSLVSTEYIESGATTGTAGILENTPRFNYSFGASCPSLLLEPSRTNLIKYSEYYAAGQWANTDVSLTTNYALSPEGKINASLWEFPTTNISARIQYVLGGVTAGATYTQSYYIKSLSGDLTLRIGTSSTVAGEFEDITATSEWKRFDFTSVASGTTEYPRIQNISGTQGAQILVYGAMVESNASFASSYIPTYGTSQTRAADVCGNAGDANTFNSTEGVLYAEIAALANNLAFRVLSISDGTNDNTIKIGYRSDSNAIYVEIKSVSVAQVFLVYTTTDITTFHKVAVKYKENDFALWVNGVEVATDTSGTTFSSGTLNKLSFNRGNDVNNFYGKTKQVLTFNTALSDADLAALTTI